MLHPEASRRMQAGKAPQVNLSAPKWSGPIYRSLIEEHIGVLSGEDQPEYVIEPNGTAINGADRQARIALLLLLQQTLRGQAPLKDELRDEFHGLWEHLEHLREALPALIDGDYRALIMQNESIFAYVRETGRQRCYVILNFSSHPQSIEMRRIGKWIAGTHLTDGDGEVHLGGKFELEAYEGRLYELRRGDIDVPDI